MNRRKWGRYLWRQKAGAYLPIFVLLGIATSSAFGLTCTTTSISNGAWSAGGNWSGGVPTAASDACIGSGFTITLTLNGTTNGLNISSGTLVLNSGTLTAGVDGITLNGGNITAAVIGSAQISGAITATGVSNITASANTLEILNAVSNSGTLGLVVSGGIGNRLLLDSTTAATSLTFGGILGRLELNTSGTLTLTDALSIAGHTVTLDGSGSKLTDGAGISLSTGTITGLGTVAGAITATGAATINAAGGTLELASNVSNSGTLALTIGGGASDKMLLDGQTAATSLAFAGSTGTLELASSGSLAVANALSIGGNTVKLDGSGSQLTDNSGISLSTGAISGSGKITGPIAATGSATITASGGILELSGSVANSGSLLMKVGSGASDTLLVDGGAAATSLIYSGTTGNLEVNVFGDLSLTNALAVGANTVKLDGPVSRLTALAGITVNGGLIEGSGTIVGDVTLSATSSIHPGTSPGILSISGNYDQGGGTSVLDIGGLTAGTGYSQLAVSGTARLSGIFDFRTINGFTPSAGDIFDVLNFGSVLGDFSGFELNGVGCASGGVDIWSCANFPGLLLSENFSGGTALNITVNSSGTQQTPEPPTPVLIGVGLVCLAGVIVLRAPQRRKPAVR